MIVAPQSASGFIAHLEEAGILSMPAAQRAASAFGIGGHAFDRVMTELGLLGEEELAARLSAYLDLAPATDSMLGVSQLPDGIDVGFLRDNAILPLVLDDSHVELAVADPFARETLDAFAFHLERPVRLRVAPRRRIMDVLDGLTDKSGDAAVSDAVDLYLGSDDIERLRDMAREAPVVRLVNETIEAAVAQHATDIHIEPLQDHGRIRFRCDGLLTVVDTVPLNLLPGVATRIKIIARLNIAERRLPQDGRVRIAVRGTEVDLRISIVPSVHGETIVLRILDRSGVELRLDRLDFDEAARTEIRSLAAAANGIVLVTGPTGSGKTTTLYSLLNERQDSDLKIFTIEDPVEYRLTGVTQLQVNPAVGLDFPLALRSILRQDPDIILVGEIRDRETAQIAIQAALTGHLVLSTLHTNSAAGALTRLRDMGLDPYLLGATVRGVVAQRLVRKLCPQCKERGGPSSDCPTCAGRGYAGRTVAYEVLRVSPTIAALVTDGASQIAIGEAAQAQGMRSMQDQVTGLVASGITSIAEVQRVIDPDGS